MCKMRLIVFPGQMDSVFFLNELKYLTEVFEQVVVFAYQGNKENYEHIASDYKLKYSTIKNITLYSIIKGFYVLFTDKEIRKEIYNRILIEGNLIIKLKRIVYLFIYINYAINVEDKYRNYMNDGYKNILYSFWLSRNAFAVAYINKLHTVYKSISRAHGYDLYEERNSINYLPFREYIYKYLNVISFISRDGLCYFKKKYQKNDKLVVSYLGTSNIHNIKKEYRKKNSICIVSCSNIIQVKRIDIIIDLLSNMDLPIQWIHIGDGDLRNEIEKYAKKKLKSNYTFMGNINNSEILNIYLQKDADFFINMSDSEGIPVSIMEGLSFGMPVIARNVGGISEIINEDNGIFLDINNGILKESDRLKLKSFLETRLMDVDRYITLSEGARSFWKNNFESERNYQKFISLCLK